MALSDPVESSAAWTRARACAEPRPIQSFGAFLSTTRRRRVWRRSALGDSPLTRGAQNDANPVHVVVVLVAILSVRNDRDGGRRRSD